MGGATSAHVLRSSCRLARGPNAPPPSGRRGYGSLEGRDWSGLETPGRQGRSCHVVRSFLVTWLLQVSGGRSAGARVLPP